MRIGKRVSVGAGPKEVVVVIVDEIPGSRGMDGVVLNILVDDVVVAKVDGEHWHVVVIAHTVSVRMLIHV